MKRKCDVGGRVWVVALLGVAIPSVSALAGTLQGTTTIAGDPIERRKVIKMNADPTCASLHKKPVGTENVIVSKANDEGTRTIRNVMIYVKSGLGNKKFEVPVEPVEIDQHGCMYRPHVLALMTGQKMTVLNSDNTLHNIHGLPQKNPEFNFGQPKAGMHKDLTFKRAEIFKVKCDVHPWMGAYVGVFTNPFHAVSDREGNYEIKDLPPGDYEITAWHEVYGEFTQKVTVKADGDTTLNFVLSKKK